MYRSAGASGHKFDSDLLSCRDALQTGLAQKRKPESAAQARSSKKQSGMMSAVLGDLSGDSSDDEG